MKEKSFYRHFEKKGFPLYWIFFIYLILGWIFPVVGWAALICMLGPVLTSIWKGRFWCGNVCPRGSVYDRLLSKYSPHRPIPKFVRTSGFRLFMVCFIFAMFGVQMYFAWGDWSAMGFVFWKIIVATTIVGVVLAFIYAPRTWCSFCPMGTMSKWVAPKKSPFSAAFKHIHVSERCTQKCKMCARVCPMQLEPYSSRGEADGYLNPDCIKCGNCVEACPLKCIILNNHKNSLHIMTI